jgi:hypothetical protein
VVLTDACAGVTCADKAIAAATPRRAGAAALVRRFDLRADLLRGQPKGLLPAKFALTWKAYAGDVGRSPPLPSERLTSREPRSNRANMSKIGQKFFYLLNCPPILESYAPDLRFCFLDHPTMAERFSPASYRWG